MESETLRDQLILLSGEKKIKYKKKFCKRQPKKLWKIFGKNTKLNN